MINIVALMLAVVGSVTGTYAAWIWFGAANLQLVIGESHALAAGGIYIKSCDVMGYLRKVGTLNRRAALLASVAILCSSAACFLSTCADVYLN